MPPTRARRRYRRTAVFALSVPSALSVLIALAGPATSAAVAPAPSARPSGTARTRGAHLISHSREAVPFVADDYARALAAARAQRVPIFVEAWAPW